MKLKGKIAIITGGAAGIGFATAKTFLKEGASVAICDVNGEKIDKAVAELSAVGTVKGYVADISKKDQVENMVQAILAAFGRIDILVNNAGIIMRNDSVDFTEKEWDDVMNINLKTVFFMCQAVARQFIKQGTGGKIVNVASMLSFQGGIRVPSYTASKSGVKGITMLMANEWAKHGVNVNAIAPGYMATDNTTQLRADEARSAEILGRIPAGRWGLPEDLGGAVVFLASKAADYVNGYTVAVDGGWLAR